MAVRTFGIAGKTDSAEDYRITASGLLVPASALNPRTGVLSTPVLTSTGSLTCTVSPCTVAIDGTSNSLQAGYLVTNDLTTTVTFATGSAAARTDLICLQVLDNAYDGSGQSKGQITYVQGASGGGVPATPANSIVLWQVPVGAGASSVNFASAVAVFPYTAAAGGVVPVRSASDKPAVVNGVQLRFRLDVAAGGASPLEWSTDGVTYTPTFDPAASSSWSAWTNLTPTSPYVTSTQPRFRTAPGGLVQMGGSVQYTGATGAVSTATVFNSGLPACTGVKPALPVVQFSNTTYSGYVSFNSTGMSFSSPNIANNAFINLDNLIYQTG